LTGARHQRQRLVWRVGISEGWEEYAGGIYKHFGKTTRSTK